MSKYSSNVVPKGVMIETVGLSAAQCKCLAGAAANIDYWSGMPDEPVGDFLKREISDSDPLQRSLRNLKLQLETMKENAQFIVDTLRALNFRLVGDFLTMSVKELCSTLVNFWVTYKDKVS